MHIVLQAYPIIKDKKIYIEIRKKLWKVERRPVSVHAPKNLIT